MNMQQTQHPVASEWMLKVFYFITKPFQITKVLELLYALNWAWYFILSFLPRDIVAGPVMQSTKQFNQPLISIVLLVITGISFYGLWTNQVYIRRLVLVWNIAVVFYLWFRLVFQLPIIGTAGYLFILGGLSIFSYWRMDTH